MSKPFSVREACWQGDDEAALRMIRETVFIQEQQVAIELEWDGEDEAATHLLALDDANQPIGCARLLTDGHIGRMAVLKPWRRKGVGTSLLKSTLKLAQEKHMPSVMLDAQVHAIPFYQRLGFQVCSDEFMDAGIPHKQMYLKFSET